MTGRWRAGGRQVSGSQKAGGRQSDDSGGKVAGCLHRHIVQVTYYPNKIILQWTLTQMTLTRRQAGYVPLISLFLV
jgi:hypothetical protein